MHRVPYLDRSFSAEELVALLPKMTCNLRHPMEATMHRVPCLDRSFSAKEPYN